MGEQKKERPKLQVDKASVQRLLDAANILRAVTSQEDIDRIKKRLEFPDGRIPLDSGGIQEGKESEILGV